MLIQINLLDYLAYKLRYINLSDLRLISQDDRLRGLIAEIPLDACSEWEWMDAAQYLTGGDCASALEARKRLIG